MDVSMDVYYGWMDGWMATCMICIDVCMYVCINECKHLYIQELEKAKLCPVPPGLPLSSKGIRKVHTYIHTYIHIYIHTYIHSSIHPSRVKSQRPPCYWLHWEKHYRYVCMDGWIDVCRYVSFIDILPTTSRTLQVDVAMVNAGNIRGNTAYPLDKKEFTYADLKV